MFKKNLTSHYYYYVTLQVFVYLSVDFASRVQHAEKE